MDDPFGGKAQIEHIAVCQLLVEKFDASTSRQIAREASQRIHGHPIVPENHLSLKGREVGFRVHSCRVDAVFGS